MSDLKASVVETQNGFHVEGYEKIEYDFTFLDGVFNPENTQLTDCYKRWGRCLAIMDLNIFNLYGDAMQKYFDYHKLELKIHKTMIGEKAKSIDTFLSIVDSMTDFGIIRKEPVLVVVCSRRAAVLRIELTWPGRWTCYGCCWVKPRHATEPLPKSISKALWPISHTKDGLLTD